MTPADINALPAFQKMHFRVPNLGVSRSKNLLEPCYCPINTEVRNYAPPPQGLLIVRNVVRNSQTTDAKPLHNVTWACREVKTMLGIQSAVERIALKTICRNFDQTKAVFCFVQMKWSPFSIPYFADTSLLEKWRIGNVVTH